VAHKKTPARRAKKTALAALSSRVSALENDFSAMRSDMASLSEDVTALRTVTKRVDERAARGENLMLDMQLELRRTARAVDRIAEALKVPGSTPHNYSVATIAAEVRADMSTDGVEMDLDEEIEKPR
jgi:outer membrane murein-binding lipoprotein Lpp